MPMTNAEKQRRYRQRQKANLALAKEVGEKYGRLGAIWNQVIVPGSDPDHPDFDLMRSDALTGTSGQRLEQLRNMQAEADVLQERLASMPEGDTTFDTKAREFSQLQASVDVGEILDNILAHRESTGALAEVQKELGINSNQVPLDLIRNAVTPPPTNHPQGAEYIGPVFAGGDAAYLGVPMPTVAAGERVYNVVGTRPTVGGPHTDSTSVAESDGTWTSEVLAPARMQASFFYRRTDAVGNPGMGDALRSALNGALGEKLDQEVVDQIITDVTQTDAAGADTFATVKSRFIYPHLDGRHASTEGALRLLVGADTLSDWSTLYRSNNSDDSAVETVRRLSGGLRVSALLPATASNKQTVIIRKGNLRDAVAPIWEGVTLIPDEITKAATGEIVITAVMLGAFKVLRTAGFARVEAQHA